MHVLAKDADFCGVTPCGVSESYRIRRPLSSGHHQKTDLASPSETSGNASRLQDVILKKTTIFHLVSAVL